MYRSMVVPFLVVGAIAVPCWLVFRQSRLRIRARPLSLRREILLLTIVLYLSGLAAATLTPNHPSRKVVEASVELELRPNLASLTCSAPSMPMGSTARSFCVRNARGNFVLFFPLGVLIPLAWKRLRFWRQVQIAIALSVSIELFQYLSRAWVHRTADVNDVILNSAGACLGVVVVALLRLRQDTRTAVPRA
ncbi:MAG: VanZ family protein [bacterium]